MTARDANSQSMTEVHSGGTVDPITLSIVWSKLMSIVEEMGSTLRRTAYSPAVREGDSLSGEAIRAGGNGAPVLESAVAHVECKVAQIVELGDHHIVVGEVVGANVAKAPEGRADEAILEMKELGEKVFYGG